jgi:hypothetical protein
MAEESGFVSQLGQEIFLFSSSGTYLTSYPMATRNNSFPSSAELKKGGALPSLPYVIMVWCLIKHMTTVPCIYCYITEYILLICLCVEVGYNTFTITLQVVGDTRLMTLPCKEKLLL